MGTGGRRRRFWLGREAALVVEFYGIGDGVRPGVGTEGVDVLVLREADGLEKHLEEESDGAGGARFEVALDDGRDELHESGGEVASGDVIAGEEEGEIVGEFGGDDGLRFFLGVVEAEVGVGRDTRSTATAAVGEGETAERQTVLRR